MTFGTTGKDTDCSEASVNAFNQNGVTYLMSPPAGITTAYGSGGSGDFGGGGGYWGGDNGCMREHNLSNGAGGGTSFVAADLAYSFAKVVKEPIFGAGPRGTGQPLDSLSEIDTALAEVPSTTSTQKNAHGGHSSAGKSSIQAGGDGLAMIWW